jgi:threonine synthase
VEQSKKHRASSQEKQGVTSYLSHLECSHCGDILDADQVQTYCKKCVTPLLPRYDLEEIRDQIDKTRFRSREPGLWRWREILPVRHTQNVVTLGEGDAPILASPRLGKKYELTNLYLKDESVNPTGTFKALGLSVAISRAVELGVENVIIPTAGNAGGALAAYAARAGIQAHVYMPKDTPKANMVETMTYNANIELVDGLINDAARLAKAQADADGLFDVSTFKEPYRVEGKKIMGYEVAEFFNWTLPDVIVYPTGGGTGLVGMWKAFAEMEALGWLEDVKRPRMVSVQAEGCAPVVKAFEEEADTCEVWENADTLAAGLRVPKSFADRLILNTLRESGGKEIAVSDQEIFDAQNELAVTEGIFAAPEGAATLAGLKQLLKAGWIQPDERIVLFVTGTGLKYI